MIAVNISGCTFVCPKKKGLLKVIAYISDDITYIQQYISMPFSIILIFSIIVYLVKAKNC